MNLEVAAEVAEYLGIPIDELLERHDNFLSHQLARWHCLLPGDAKGLAEYYNDNLYLYELISTPSFGLVRLVQPFLSERSSILDFGSGIGTHGFHFLRRGHDLTFVDLPSPHFEFVRWYAARQRFSARLVERDDIHSLASEAFDAIFCFDVLEHVVDWRETVALLSRLLKPEGRLFLVVSFREFEEHAIHIASRTGLTESAFQKCMAQNELVEIFHRERPVPLTHPLEPLKVFARREDPSFSRLGELFPAGEAFLRQGALTEAERCFAELVAWNPEDFAAHRELARISLSEEHFEEARERVGRALELLSDDVASLELDADVCLRSGNRIDAARRYALALVNWPGLAIHARSALAQLIHEETVFVAVSSDLVTWREKLAFLSFLIGCRAHQRAAGVAHELTATLTQDSYSGYLVWKEHARLLRETGRIPEAVSVLEQLAMLHPARPWIHFDLSLCHSALGSHDAAISELDIEESRSPSRSTVLFEKGLVRKRQGKLQAALALFGDAIRLFPEFAEAAIEYARALAAVGDGVAALAAYRQAATLVPNDDDVLFEQAMLCRFLGDIDGARDDLLRLVKRRPENAEAWFCLGRLEMEAGRRWIAIGFLNRAYLLAPNEMWPRFVFGEKLVLATLGLPARIAAWWRGRYV